MRGKKAIDATMPHLKTAFSANPDDRHSCPPPVDVPNVKEPILKVGNWMGSEGRLREVGGFLNARVEYAEVAVGVFFVGRAVSWRNYLVIVLLEEGSQHADHTSEVRKAACRMESKGFLIRKVRLNCKGRICMEWKQFQHVFVAGDEGRVRRTGLEQITAADFARRVSKITMYFVCGNVVVDDFCWWLISAYGEEPSWWNVLLLHT